MYRSVVVCNVFCVWAPCLFFDWCGIYSQSNRSSTTHHGRGEIRSDCLSNVPRGETKSRTDVFQGETRYHGTVQYWKTVHPKNRPPQHVPSELLAQSQLESCSKDVCMSNRWFTNVHHFTGLLASKPIDIFPLVSFDTFPFNFSYMKELLAARRSNKEQP